MKIFSITFLFYLLQFYICFFSININAGGSDLPQHYACGCIMTYLPNIGYMKDQCLLFKGSNLYFDIRNSINPEIGYLFKDKKIMFNIVQLRTAHALKKRSRIYT